MKSLFILALSVLLSVLASAAPSLTVTLDSKASKELYSKLNVKIEDHDDVINKNFVTSDSRLAIGCDNYVLDKTFSCLVTLSAPSVKLDGTDASRLYRALRVSVKDHDDVQVKKLRVWGLELKCEHYVVDEAHACIVSNK